MRCLLCNHAIGPLRRHTDDLWTVACPGCGTYRFDAEFADLVKRARAHGDRELLRSCVVLADVVRDHDDVLTIRKTTYARLADSA